MRIHRPGRNDYGRRVSAISHRGFQEKRNLETDGGRNYLNTWSERLAEYKEYEIPARQILKSLSTQPAGLERRTMLDILMTGQDISQVEEVDYRLSKILEMLENDGYIIKKDSIRTFRSPLLRDYWFNKFVQ